MYVNLIIYQALKVLQWLFLSFKLFHSDHVLMTQKQLSGYDSIKDWGSHTEADELIAGMCEWTPGAAGEWSHAHNESETEYREEMVDRRDGGVDY